MHAWDGHKLTRVHVDEGALSSDLEGFEGPSSEVGWVCVDGPLLVDFAEDVEDHAGERMLGDGQELVGFLGGGGVVDAVRFLPRGLLDYWRVYEQVTMTLERIPLTSSLASVVAVALDASAELANFELLLAILPRIIGEQTSRQRDAAAVVGTVVSDGLRTKEVSRGRKMML